MIIVKLQPKKESPILGGHPWIFAGAIDKVDGSHEKALCRVVDSHSHFLCQGFYNPYSQIAVRVLSMNKEPINREFFRKRIEAARIMRQKLISPDTNCFRLVNAEGDGIPGLVIDVYHEVLVIQFLCLGMERFKEEIVEILQKLYPGYIIHERSDTKSRKAEGLDSQSGPLAGELPGSAIEVMENGLRLAVDVKTGDRTGFYLDGRVNREKFRRACADKDVLDLYSYTGAFALYAAVGGAKSVVSVDASAPAKALLKQNMDLNNTSQFVWKHQKDEVLRFLNQDTNQYDIVVCDPPPFGKVEEYMQLIKLVMGRIRSGGQLFITSAYAPKFSKIDLIKAITRCALTLSRQARVIDILTQGPDYPFLSSHPEGEHLHGYVVYLT